MKTRTNLITRKSLLKILSGILCAALTMQLGLGLTDYRINAASEPYLGYEDSDQGACLYLSNGIFTIGEYDDGYLVISDNTGEIREVSGEIWSIELTDGADLNINTDTTAEILSVGTDSFVFLYSNLAVNEISGSGTIQVNEDATLSLDSFAGDENLRYSIDGTISANTFDLTADYLFGSDDKTLFVASSSFSKGNYDLKGTVIAGSDETRITSAGGSFTLVLNGASMDIQGAVDDTAGNLLLSVVEVGLYTQDLPGFSADDPLYEGDNYDFMGGVYTDPEGCEGYVTLEYAASDSESYSSTKPTAPGTYKVRAVLPSSSEWIGSTSEAYTYTIKDPNALSLSEVSATGNYYSVEGTYQCQWGTLYVDTVRVVPASGFLIACPTVGDDEFAEYLDVDPAQMTDAQFRYKRISDGKTTDYTSAGNFSYLVPDEEEPEFEYYSTLDGEWIDIHDGDTFYGNELHIIVYDHHIYQFKINGEMIFEQQSNTWTNVAGEYIYSEPGVTKEINVYVLDYAERTLEATIYLVGPENDSNVSLGTVPDVYYGQDYDFSNLVSVADGYDKSLVYFEYSDDGSYFDKDKPTAVGSYYVRAVAPGTETYSISKSDNGYFSIGYLGFGDLFPNGSKTYDSVSGVVNGKYVAGDIVLTMPEGILIKGYSFASDKDFSNTITLTPDDVLIDGHANVDALIQLRRASDNATTNGNISLFQVYPEIENLIYDFYDPVFFAAVYNSEGEDREISLNQDVIVGKKLEVVVRDDNLSSVTVTIDGTKTNETVEDNQCHIYLNSVTGKSQQIKITATDLAGRVSEAEFSFMPEQVESTISLSVPDTIYAGDDYGIEVSTNNTEGTVSIEYYHVEDEEPIDGQPKAAGDYVAFVTIEANDFYTEAADSIEFTISKRTCTLEITVKRTYVGVAPSVELSTLSDGKNLAVFEYKKSGDSDETYTEVIPSAAGIYVLRVTIPETDKYLSCSDTCEIYVDSSPSVKVSVDDIYYGEKPDPKITINSIVSGRTEKPKYKLISAPDSAYSETVPTAIGEYKVSVSTYFSSYDLTITTYDTFSIMKAPVEATVTVPKTYVNNPVEPEIIVKTSNYDGDINNAVFEYKAADADDEAYSTTVPTAAGTYNIKATIRETAIYEEVICTSEFSISKIPVTATISVSDTLVGTTPVTELSMDQAEYDGEYSVEYKAISAPDTAYSTMVPTSEGSYIARFKLPDTDTYLGTTVTDDFTISKNNIDGISVTVANIFVGGTVKPVMSGVPADYDGTITYTYKLTTDEDFSATVPTAAGTYNVKATLSSSNKYLGTSCTNSFTISKNTIDGISVSAANIFVGGTVKPVMSGVPADYDGTITYTYKLTTDEDFSATVPTAAGTYDVNATLPTTDKYVGTSCTSSFTISKNTIDGISVSAANIFVGGTVKPVMSGVPSDYDGTITYTYKLTTDEDFSATVPTAAGTYDVKATLPTTDKYIGSSCTSSFTISKNSATAEVSVANITVGNKPEPVVTTVSNGKADATFEYKAADADDSEYSDTIPTAAGTYSVRATVPATAEYLGITCTSEFTISLNKVTVMDLTVEDIYYGQTVKPSFKTDSDGSVTIMYKLTVAPDSAYSTTVPTVTGKYTARATVSETDTYEGAVCYKEFSISYLEAPQVAYNPTGKSGNEGYFTSDVQLAAPEGYTISATTDGEYSKSIPYTEGMDKIYLKRDDGALTSAITITNKPMIDKSAPAITTSTGSIADGSVMYASDMSITITDTNLKSLKVNDEVIDIKAGTSNVITLSPGYGIKKFVIIAEDIAGNVTTIEFTLKAEWLENKIILPDVSLPLFSEESYTLDDGQWIVTKNTTSGAVKDTTVYNGDLPVYVNEDGDYTFTKVT